MEIVTALTYYSVANIRRQKYSPQQILSLARQTISNDGISHVAESLKKIYNHDNKRDSAFFYSEIQIAYKDSVSNLKKGSLKCRTSRLHNS